MKTGLVGFAGCGKSTVFSALTRLETTTKGGLGSIWVPDHRVERLAAIWHPRKTTFAGISFVDLPSGSFLEKTVSSGALGRMRNLEVLAEVVDAFSSGGDEAAANRAMAFHDELILADLSVAEKRLERLSKEKTDGREAAVLEICREALERGRELSEIGLDEQGRRLISGFGFLTQKPRIVVVNVSEDKASERLAGLREQIRARGQEFMVMSAPLEMELTRLGEEDGAEFLADLGLQAGARDRFVAVCYSMLDLISFLTVGNDEVRAWPVARGTTAVEAAAKIHSDIGRGFIRAEVIAYDDYVAFADEAACREAGKLRVQGRDYVVNDGDVVHFRFNV